MSILRKYQLKHWGMGEDYWEVIFSTEVRWLYVFLFFSRVCLLSYIICSALMITNFTQTYCHQFRSRPLGQTVVKIFL